MKGRGAFCLWKGRWSDGPGSGPGSGRLLEFCTLFSYSPLCALGLPRWRVILPCSGPGPSVARERTLPTQHPGASSSGGGPGRKQRRTISSAPGACLPSPGLDDDSQPNALLASTAGVGAALGSLHTFLPGREPRSPFMSSLGLDSH